MFMYILTCQYTIEDETSLSVCISVTLVDVFLGDFDGKKSEPSSTKRHSKLAETPIIVSVGRY